MASKHPRTENPTKATFRVGKKPMTRETFMRDLKKVAEATPPKK